MLGVFIAYGLPRRDKEKYFISHVVIGPDGQYVTHYDKVHLVPFGSPRETDYFAPGERLGVFQVGEITVGIVICYDFRFADYIVTGQTP